MIATTRTCSTQFGRFAAKRLISGSNPRQAVSVSASPSFSWPSNNTYEARARNYSNTNSHTYQPMGDLFQYAKEQQQQPSYSNTSIVIGDDFVGKTASINRAFGPGSNAQALLTCGGHELAQQASFDPDYKTAKSWIRSRPVGPAVLSPTLISGLVGALTEASFPQTVPLSSSMNFLHPLIVGMEVSASIRVESVRQTKRDGRPTTNGNSNGNGATTDTGYEILLLTKVTRVMDEVIIAEGNQTVWIPGYL